MNRLFIIGAGFSHALTGLPLGRDLANIIYQKAQEVLPEEARLYELAQDYLRVWRYLQHQSEPLREYLQSDGTQIETLDGDTYPIDLEYLLTLIDLNLNNPYVPKGIGVDLQSCPIPYMREVNHFVLQNTRQFIQHQIYDLMKPESYDAYDVTRMQKLMSLVSPGDAIVTFNYDLLIEQGLIKQNLWNPEDGYGIGELCESERLPEDLPATQVKLVKLHGSINWSKGSLFESIDVLVHAADFDNTNFFEDIQVESTHPPYHQRYPRNSILIMPSYLKLYDQPYEVQLVSRTLEAARTADEVYMIGYSLPKADITANLIISQIRKDARIIIVNKNHAKEIKGRLSETYGFEKSNIIQEESDIETWIDNDFEYCQYQRDQESEAIFQDMLRLSEE